MRKLLLVSAILVAMPVNMSKALTLVIFDDYATWKARAQAWIAQFPCDYIEILYQAGSPQGPLIFRATVTDYTSRVVIKFETPASQQPPSFKTDFPTAIQITPGPSANGLYDLVEP